MLRGIQSPGPPQLDGGLPKDFGANASILPPWSSDPPLPPSSNPVVESASSGAHRFAFIKLNNSNL